MYLGYMEKDYLTHCGLSETPTLEEAKHKLFWGTYGLPITLPVRWVRLIDCSTEHLKNILRTQKQISDEFITVIQSILNDRNKHFI